MRHPRPSTHHDRPRAGVAARREGQSAASCRWASADIITCCMRKDPAARFQTMDDLVNALVGIYRTISGAGMSSYLEAFPGQRRPQRADRPQA